MPVLRRLLHMPLGLFRSSVPVPDEHRADFRNLYFDIGWYGIVNGSVLSFLTIYLARIGASGSQIGLINAVPAITGLFLVLWIGRWMKGKPIRKIVFLSSIAQRFFYLPLIVMPFFLSNQAQTWTVIALTLLMSIPGTALVIGFNSMFADLVPSAWRGYVAGIRNALLAIVSTIITILCGWLLVTIPFPAGYQVVFALGTLGAFLSSLHLYLIAKPSMTADFSGLSIREDLEVHPGQGTKKTTASKTNKLRTDLLLGPFGRILVLMFFFHLAQYLSIPIFPLFLVNYAKYSDQLIGIHSATFSLAVFLGSSQLDHISRRLGNQKLMGFGIVAMSSYPILVGLSRGAVLFILAAITGGLAWAMVSGVLYNYLYERIPQNERSVYLSWYTLFLNAAVLIASLAGPAIASVVDLSLIMVIFGVFRIAAGTAILIWG